VTQFVSNRRAPRRAALLDAKGVFRRKPPDTHSERELLKNAADARATAGTGPLLLVIDQFEEFLILHGEAARSAFTGVAVRSR
jgi:hypothetical protein